MAEVSWTRPEVRNFAYAYSLIRDVLEGSEAMKGRRNTGNTTAISGINGFENLGTRYVTNSRRYLPQPNALDKSPQNLERYRMYVERAQWYGATARTLEGMVGEIFDTDPIITVPPDLEPMLNNVDGAGTTMEQQMRRSGDYGVAYGRGGLLTDYPATDGSITQADVNAQTALPTITCYAPWQIINWRIEQKGSQQLLTLVVLIDDNVYDTTDDFESIPIMQFRVLMLEADGTHSVQIWRENTGQQNVRAARKKYTIYDYFQPLAPGGKRLTQIPFTFFGAKNNDPTPDKPPMLDLAEVNVGHLRNSADYEDSVHMLGQPTPWATGLTVQWYKEVWESKKIPLGSRAVIALPAGGAMGLLQTAPNSLAYEAMKEKESMMIKLGAKLMEESTGSQTATGELIDETSETSLLKNVSNNIAAAYKFALRQACIFMGIAPDDTKDSQQIVVTLNTSFQHSNMTPGERQELVGEWQKQAISWTEMRAGLRGTGVTTLSDDDAKAEIEKEMADAIATGMLSFVGGVQQTVPGQAPPPPPGQAANPVPPPVKEKPKGKATPGAK